MKKLKHPTSGNIGIRYMQVGESACGLGISRVDGNHLAIQYLGYVVSKLERVLQPQRAQQWSSAGSRFTSPLIRSLAPARNRPTPL